MIFFFFYSCIFYNVSIISCITLKSEKDVKENKEYTSDKKQLPNLLSESSLYQEQSNSNLF